MQADQTHRRVSVTGSPDTGGLTNVLLPEDLLLEILSDRLQVRHGHIVHIVLFLPTIINTPFYFICVKMSLLSSLPFIAQRLSPRCRH